MNSPAGELGNEGILKLKSPPPEAAPATGAAPASGDTPSTFTLSSSLLIIASASALDHCCMKSERNVKLCVLSDSNSVPILVFSL